MSEHAQEIILYVLGISLAIVPLFREVYRIFRPASNPKKPKLYLLFLLIIGIGLIWLGIVKVNRDETQKAIDIRNADSLRTNIQSLIMGRKRDSIKNAEFLISLEKTYHIIKDSLTNKPKIQVFNTNIEKATNVNIGH